MRDNLPPNAKKIEDAPCGCERYAVDAHDAFGKVLKGGSVIALHTCTEAEEEPKPKAKVAAKK